MNNTIKYITLALLLVFTACEDDTVRHTLETPPDTMRLSVSPENIVLDQDKKEEKAVTFTWSNASNRGEGTELTYYFKMDVANNNFETSIAKVEIPAGTREITFTHKDMNNLLAGWKVQLGTPVALEAEIIAEVSKSDVYLKPEISKIEFNVTGYVTEARDLFIVGTAVDGMQADKALKMNEEIPEQKYTWSGVLQAGNFKFIRSNTSLFPSYTQGVNSNTLTYNETETGSETLFQITTPGFYTITLNVEALTIDRQRPESAYDKIWMIGGATPAGWNIMSSVELQKDPVNQVAFIYEGQLYPGELKFPLELKDDWDVPFLMPVADQTGITGDNRMEHVPAGTEDHDYKWRIQDTGLYKVTLNTYEMTIKFEKQQTPEIPSDVPYKAVFMTGDATPNGWYTPFTIAFMYDHTAGKGTFVWEGVLNAGQIKFPLSNTSGFECDYLMPKNVDASNIAPLTETAMEMIPYPASGENDKKWEVTDAGTYKITLNVINMTVHFEKK